jgi:hypothetical protein
MHMSDIIEAVQPPCSGTRWRLRPLRRAPEKVAPETHKQANTRVGGVMGRRRACVRVHPGGVMGRRRAHGCMRVRPRMMGGRQARVGHT